MQETLQPPINFNSFKMVVKGRPVDEARCAVADWAIESKLKYLFFLGEDTVPPPSTLSKLIFLAENNPQMDVIGAMYWSKSDPTFPLVFRESGAGSYWDWKLGELFQIWGMGMDATLIRVESFAKIKKPYFLTIKADASVDGVNYGEAWTEDLYFCDKLAKAGGKVFCDSSLQCDHWDIFTMRVYRMPQNCRPAIRMETVGKSKILDLGCGEIPNHTNDGRAMRVDLREDLRPDFRADIMHLPFKTGSWDQVQSAHTLEHYPRAKVPLVLDEWIRMVKPGGLLRLILPDLKVAARQILKGNLDNGMMNVLYGGQQDAYDFHRNGFTEETIRALLNAKGMVVNRAWSGKPYNLFIEAEKPKNYRELVGEGQGRRIYPEDVRKTKKRYEVPKKSCAPRSSIKKP